MTIVRYTLPTKYDVAPYGTIVEVHGDNDIHQGSYIQLGDEAHIAWMILGDFMVSAFRKELDDPEFLKGCLDLYKSQH